MDIIVNGEIQNVEGKPTVTELLLILEVKMPEYVSVQINEELIARKDFESVTVNEGDNVEFIYFMGGGSKGRKDETVYQR